MGKASVFLLVEPSPILRSSLHDWLGHVFAGYQILVAANGVEALRLAVQEQPSHILIEMELPEKAGFEVLRQMRQILNLLVSLLPEFLPLLVRRAGRLRTLSCGKDD